MNSKLTLTLLLAITGAHCQTSSAVTKLSPFVGTAITTGPTFSTFTGTTSLSLGCPSGEITIHCDTGVIDLPKDAKLPQAAKEFWEELAKVYPSIRSDIIAQANQERTAREAAMVAARNEMILSAIDQGLKATASLRFNLAAQARAFVADPKIVEVILENTAKVVSWENEMEGVSRIIKAEQAPAKGTP